MNRWISKASGNERKTHWISKANGTVYLLLWVAYQPKIICSNRRLICCIAEYETVCTNLCQYIVQRSECLEMICKTTAGRKQNQLKYSLLHYVDGLLAGDSPRYREIPKNMYISLCFEVIDYLIQQLHKRFESDTYLE